MAIQRFIQQYESRYQVSIRDYAVGKETLQEGSYFLAGILRLSFVCEKFNRLLRSSVIIKMPQLDAHHLYGEYMMCYKKEKFIYETVLPMMYHWWPSTERAVPYFFAATDLETLILENLNESGYRQNPNGSHGSLLDVSACKVALRALAQFHALSVRHVDKLRATLDSLTITDKSQSEWVTNVLLTIVSKLRMYVLPFCSVEVCIQFEEQMRNLSAILRLGQTPNVDGFNVMIHGDFHHYNVLFKDNIEQKTTDKCKIINFQHCRIGSPVLDVMLFLVTSADSEVVENHWKALFSCYLGELENIWKIALPDGPTCPYGMNDMLSDFDKYKSTFLYPLVSFVPFFWIGTCKRDLHSSEKNQQIVDEVIKSKEYISFFKGWLKHLLPKPENSISALG